MVALLFNLLSGYGEFTSFVLCIGQHGHVAVEKAGHDHGRDRLSISGNQTHAFHSEARYGMENGQSAHSLHRNSLDGHAFLQVESCLDVPIGQGDQARDSILESILQNLIAVGCTLYVVVLCLIAVVQLPALSHPRFFETNPISSTPLLRRSTVLLI
ncbi:hypothetical protein [Methylomarinum vadi]|uniref:hypothetical protein n=1 Tax=Methylomarinum vadi TaxID=438855 RepID=UPI00126835A2|nr:hypothetical protein [Methylomarinum vadi]